jgi:hypothetical protein
MNKRVYKAQVTRLMDKVSKMQGSPRQYHDLTKVWNAARERYSWRVNIYNNNGQYIQHYVGDTLAESLEYFETNERDAQWREEQAAKWEAENS